MTKTKKQKQDNEPTQLEKCHIEVVKKLYENLPDSIVDRIHALTAVMKTQFQALSFANSSAEVLEKYGKGQIEYVHEELQKYIDAFNRDLLKRWQEDKEFRKEKG